MTSAVFGILGALYAGIVAFAVLLAPDIALYTVEWVFRGPTVGPVRRAVDVTTCRRLLLAKIG